MELEETLLGYLKDDDARRHDVLGGGDAETLVSAAKCVLLMSYTFFSMHDVYKEYHVSLCPPAPWPLFIHA